MKEKTLDKIILALAIGIIALALLLAVGIFREKKQVEPAKDAVATEDVTPKEETTADASDDKVTDDKEEQTSGKASNDKVTDEEEEKTSGKVSDDKEEGKVTFDEEEDYILPESDSKYYSKSELSSLTSKQLAIARNEIYAKHGYIFAKDKEMKEYFEGKSWYKGTVKASNFDESVFNKYEKENLETIVDLEGK